MRGFPSSQALISSVSRAVVIHRHPMVEVQAVEAVILHHPETMVSVAVQAVAVQAVAVQIHHRALGQMSRSQTPTEVMAAAYPVVCRSRTPTLVVRQAVA